METHDTTHRRGWISEEESRPWWHVVFVTIYKLFDCYMFLVKSGSEFLYKCAREFFSSGFNDVENHLVAKIWK